jgi:hypothetical protein
VKANPETYDCIGEEETVKLDIEPARFTKRIIVRKKFIGSFVVFMGRPI